MDDETFWERVADRLSDPDVQVPPDPYEGAEIDVAVAPNPCPVCGADGACAYDYEGRPLIHPEDPEEYDQ